MPTRRIPLLDFWIPENIFIEQETIRKARLLIVSCLSIVGLCLFYAVFFALIDHLAATLVSVYGGLSALGLMIYFRKKGNFIIGGNFFAFTSLIVIGFYTITTSGISTIIGAWILMVPMAGFMLADRRAGVFWTFMALLLAVGIFFADIQGWVDKTIANGPYAEIVNLCSLMGLILFISVVVFSYEKGKDRALGQLHQVNEEVNSLNKQLEVQVAKRTQSLKSANEELDTFLYESAHALRRPLTRIMGLRELLSMKVTEDEAGIFNEKIDTEIKGMDKLLRNLILVSEFSDWEHQQETISPVGIVQEVWDQLKTTHFDVQITLTINMPKGLTIITDEYLLRVMLTKLLENAIVFRKQAPVIGQVIVEGEMKGKSFLLRIKDQGIGIREKIQGELFKMFIRGTENSEGSGLGLYIVGKIVQNLGGIVTLKSELNQFTEVTVQLPEVISN